MMLLHDDDNNTTIIDDDDDDDDDDERRRSSGEGGGRRTTMITGTRNYILPYILHPPRNPLFRETGWRYGGGVSRVVYNSACL